MEQAQAEALVGRLLAAFPGKPLPDSSVMVYSIELTAHRWEDGEKAVASLSRAARFFPSLPELVDELADVAHERRLRENAQRRSLPSGEGPPVPPPPEILERMRALRGRSDSLTEPRPIEEPLRYTPSNPAVLPRCSGVGLKAEFKDGKYVCSGCGVPVEEMFVAERK